MSTSDIEDAAPFQQMQALAAPQPPEPAEDVAEYTEGICADGAAILRDGQPMPISEILLRLARADAAEAALAEAKAELERVEKIAHDLTVALTDLTSGGSECFIRRGTGDRERYYADADFCSRRIRERIAGAEDRWRAEAEKRQRLTAERDRLAEAARALDEAVCNSLNRDFEFWSGASSREAVYPAWRDLHAALPSLSVPEQPAEPSETEVELAKVAWALEYPPHKREDAEFLRGCIAAARSFLDHARNVLAAKGEGHV